MGTYRYSLYSRRPGGWLHRPGCTVPNVTAIPTKGVIPIDILRYDGPSLPVFLAHEGDAPDSFQTTYIL